VSANRELLFQPIFQLHTTQLRRRSSLRIVYQRRSLSTSSLCIRRLCLPFLQMLKKPLVADDYAHTYAAFIQAAVREVGHNYRQAAKWLTRERSYRRLTGYGLSAVLTAFPFCSVILGWPMSCPPDVQGCLCLAALHRPGQWLFRVASHQRRRSKATLCRRNEERLTLRPSRTVRTGVTRTQVSGSAPLPGSRCPRTSWWVKSTTGCPLS